MHEKQRTKSGGLYTCTFAEKAAKNAVKTHKALPRDGKNTLFFHTVCRLNSICCVAFVLK